MRNYSPKTLATYRLWMRKFQSFVRSKPADELDGEDAKAFLMDLAVRQGVAASTQNQAFNALLFFDRHVLCRKFGKLDGVVRAKRRAYVPVVLSRSEGRGSAESFWNPSIISLRCCFTAAGCGFRNAWNSAFNASISKRCY